MKYILRTSQQFAEYATGGLFKLRFLVVSKQNNFKLPLEVTI